MKKIFKTGDIKEYTHIVVKEDVAAFETGLVHPVYSTFALARDAEWTCRQFVLEMKDEHEEGIGTFIHVNHKSPALIGEEVLFIAVIGAITDNEIICSYKASAGFRTVAEGTTGQKILKKEKLKSIFDELEQNKEHL
jgi:fluoroacetyl-CoA thioesterase